jgi:Ca2+-transporting ATPase
MAPAKHQAAKDLGGAKLRNWHALSVDDVARTLQADTTRGLTEAEVVQTRRQFGQNALAEAKGRSLLSILMDQFKSLIVALLLAATLVAFVLGENIEAIAILVVIVLNAGAGFFSESRAEQALTAIQRQAVASGCRSRRPL